MKKYVCDPCDGYMTLRLAIRMAVLHLEQHLRISRMIKMSALRRW